MKGILRKGLCKFITCMFACVLCVLYIIPPVYAEDETWPFSITTTELVENDQFQFYISAAGTFHIDCGTDGTLSNDTIDNTVSGPDANNVWTITRSNTNMRGYHCSYTTAGSKTIKFGGQATGYSTEDTVAAIRFSVGDAIQQTQAQKILSISGSLGQIFGTVQNPPAGFSGQPKFYRTFYGAANMTGTTETIGDQNNSGMNYALPPTLFDGISGAPVFYMFYQTFSNCSSLTGTIPANLFGNVYGQPAQAMFANTFENCRNLTGTIPAGLFSGINGLPALMMFAGTFYGCNQLSGTIPANLFGNVNGTPAQAMFAETFKYCYGLSGTIPTELFSGINGLPAPGMFRSTFESCTGLTEIPSGLFSGIEGAPAPAMFDSTFKGCSKLSGSIPVDLFGAIDGAPAGAMFDSTFKGCSKLTGTIPANLFGAIDGAPAISMFNSTFDGCYKLTGTIPANLFGNLSGAPATGMFQSTFNGCSGLNGFGDKTYVPWYFLNEINNTTSVSNQATSMFSGTMLANQCPADMYADTRTQFNDAGKPWCSPCPPGSHSPAGSTNESECLYLNVTYVCGEGTGNPWIDENSPYEENAPVTLLVLPGECIAPETRAFSEWRCTYGDDSVIEPVNGEFSMPSAPVTCTAQWNNCADGYYWSGVTNKCEPGYTITLNQQSACLNQYPAQSSEPTVLYTIHGTGVYFDEERTQPMGHMDPMEQMPTATCKIERYLPNIPTDPTHNDEPYVVIRQETVMGYNPTNEVIEGNSMSPIERTLSGGAFVGGPQGCLNKDTIDSDGYITDCGSNMGKNTTQDITWTVWNYTPPQINVMTDPPRIPGYDVSWYSNPGYLGDALTNVWCGHCDPSSAEPTKIYAKFTPQVKNVLYRPGKHAVMTPAPYTDVNAITYDGPYTALSFSDAPIKWKAEPGYVFAGWTTHLTSDHLVPEFDEDDNLIGKFTSVEHFHIASLHPYHGPDFEGLQLTAAYKCDTARGYYWNSNKTACLKDNTITYNVNAPENAGIVTPAPETVTQGTQHTLAEIEIPDGYTWTGWDCRYTDTNGEHILTPNEDNEITMPPASVTCTGTGWDCDTENGYNWTDENHTACSNEYTITYNVENTNNAEVSIPDQGTFTAFATNYSLATLSPPNGYNCSVWSCTYMDNNETTPLTVENGKISSMPAADVTCDSTCSANTLNLRWAIKGGNITEDLPNSCTYKTDTINLTVPTKTGYDFKGWKVINWEQNSTI